MRMDWPYVTIDLIELRPIYHHQFISFIWSPVYPSLGGPRQAPPASEQRSTWDLVLHPAKIPAAQHWKNASEGPKVLK